MNPPQGFDTSSAVQFVNLSWLSACLKYGKIVDVDDNYRIPNETQTVSVCIKECIEVMCWPKGKADRRYAGVTHIDVSDISGRTIDQVNEQLEDHKVEISCVWLEKPVNIVQ